MLRWMVSTIAILITLMFLDGSASEAAMYIHGMCSDVFSLVYVLLVSSRPYQLNGHELFVLGPGAASPNTLPDSA